MIPSPPSTTPAVTVDVQLALGQSALDRGEQTQAIEWFRSAARCGDARGYNMLGRCYQRGWGVMQDEEKAATYFRHAGNQGDVWAFFNLADLHLRGRGVAQDEAEAFRLYAEAAGRGHAKSLNMLGILMEEGRGVTTDLDGARALFRAGAEAGDCWAQFNHARHALQEENVADAVHWLTESLATGFPDFWRAMAETLVSHSDPRVSALAERARRLANSPNGHQG